MEKEKILLNPFPNNSWVLCVCSTSLWKHCRKRRNCLQLAISPFPTVFCPFRELSAIFIKFENVICKLFQLFGKGGMQHFKNIVLQGD